MKMRTNIGDSTFLFEMMEDEEHGRIAKVEFSDELYVILVEHMDGEEKERMGFRFSDKFFKDIYSRRDDKGEYSFGLTGDEIKALKILLIMYETGRFYELFSEAEEDEGGNDG